ncbi:hypothetical protein DSL92_06250 [Billgrantia gudaonensis]|uniref:Uncharacterized protein n=1 Tax=Billgrantia gudaonensis TaxID=376427 RepID=A0A3S0NWW9_9GAMM|nr:hypothetical protein DSL92_06250 [Halomonas gudaonensis]
MTWRGSLGFTIRFWVVRQISVVFNTGAATCDGLIKPIWRFCFASPEANRSLDFQNDGIDTELDTLYDSLLGRSADPSARPIGRTVKAGSQCDVISGFMEAEEMRAHDMSDVQWDFIA